MSVYICPYFDVANKKCKLWDTYQSSYQVETYCLSCYADYWRKCENYRAKNR